jgi:hypothetical protein
MEFSPFKLDGPVPRVDDQRSNQAARSNATRAKLSYVSGLLKTEAEELLDWLESNGFQKKGVSYRRQKGFRVWYERLPRLGAR